MHWGILIANNAVGGCEHQMELLARGLMAAGEQVTVIYTDSPHQGLRRNPAKLLDYSGIPVLRLCLRRFFRWFYLPYGRWQVRRKKIDVMIGNNAENTLFACELSKGCETAVALHIAGLGYFRPGCEKRLQLLKNVIQMADWTISNGQVAIDLAREFHVLGDKPTKVIFNAVRRFRPVSMPEQGRFHVIFVGQLYHIKDPMTLIKALEIAKKELPALTATLAGEGVLHAELQAYLDQHELNDFIRLAGHMPPDQIPYDRSDLYVNCSVSELSSGAIAEALCCGVPAVGSRVGGTPELLEGHDFSALFPAKDVQRLAELIVFFGKKPLEERVSLGRQAAKFGEKHFSMETYVAQYRDLGADMLKLLKGKK